MIATSPNRGDASNVAALPPSSTSPNSAAQRTIRKLVRDDGICILTFDRPGSSANIFDRRALTELGEEIDSIATDSKIKGLVLNSAKRSIFIAGADIKAMSENASPEDIGKLVELGQDVMNRLAALPFPTAAAIHGAAVGGGYELCLACDYRVASTDKATKIGLPETQLGILPAWGGSTRLPRLIGLPKALDIILAGKTVAAKPALKRGMVDELVHKEYLTEAAIKILRRGKRAANGHLLTNNALVAKAIAVRVRAQLMKKTRGHYPAVFEALDVATRGITKSIADSLALERESIIRLVQGDTCRNLIRIFLLQERAKKQTIPWVGPATELKSIKKTAIIGAGVMGAGIAQWLSSRRLPVILRDINAEQVAKGMAAIAKTYKDGAKRHVFTSLEVRNGLDRIYPAPTEVPLRNVDLVIEAAVEKLDLKKKIFQSLDKVAGEDTILATNTSALPISELAASTHKPERVLGLHFFNPVHRMQLVEIVAARQTSPEVLQRALSFVQQIGKLPVVVKDSPGFVVNRILMPYLIEAGNLFEAGASIEELDKAMLDFGMPMGPMRLLDEVGVDVALHVAQTIAANYGDRMRVPELLSKMAQVGLLGKKSGRGFYLHAKGKEPTVNPEVSTLLSGNTNHASRATDLQERMVLLMVNEAARCLEEEIVPDPADIDFAMIMGTGFAPFRGGPLRYSDSVGIAKIVDSMSRLVDSGAKHFAPCGLLRDLAAIGKNFYKS